MDKEKILVEALVYTARYSKQRGVKREDILNSLGTLIDRKLFDKVKDMI